MATGSGKTGESIIAVMASTRAIKERLQHIVSTLMPLMQRRTHQKLGGDGVAVAVCRGPVQATSPSRWSCPRPRECRVKGQEWRLWLSGPAGFGASCPGRSTPAGSGIKTFTVQGEIYQLLSVCSSTDPVACHPVRFACPPTVFVLRRPVDVLNCLYDLYALRAPRTNACQCETRLL